MKGIMRYLVIFVWISLFVNCSTVFCQNNDNKMDKSTYENQVLNKGWSLEDSTKKSEYELIVFVFKPDTVSTVYINWIEGMGSTSCEYVFNSDNIFFKLGLKNCDQENYYSFIYGYLNKLGQLCILMRNENLVLNKQLLKEDNWLILTEVID
jgi:hypothetical protein